MTQNAGGQQAGSLTNNETADQLATELRSLGIVPMGDDLPMVEGSDKKELTVSTMRRLRLSYEEDEIGILTLIDQDGILSWEEGPVTPSSWGVGGRAFRRTRASGDVVAQFKFAKKLGVSEVAKQLTSLDSKLTPEGPTKLLQWTSASGLDQTAVVPREGEVLLFVHGTSSNSANLFRELTSTPKGDALLKAAERQYDAILAFDHYTISRSPYLNAVELDRFFRNSNTEVDVVCHSRGGLVVRWWAEYLDRSNHARNVVLVGCPLGGTSLADPTSLREGLNFLTNIGRVLGTGASLIPFLTVAGGLVQLISSIGAFVSKTPVVDAAISMVPGIAAMSRTDNNYELASLNPQGPLQNGSTHYFAVLSDFEPENLEIWKFWRVFSDRRPQNLVSDRVVFKQANDLIVDTDSMAHHVFQKPLDDNDPRLCVFRPDEHVHHSGYFRNDKALDFMAGCLGITLA